MQYIQMGHGLEKELWMIWGQTIVCTIQQLWSPYILFLVVENWIIHIAKNLVVHKTVCPHIIQGKKLNKMVIHGEKCDRKSHIKNYPIRTHFRTHLSKPFPHALPHAHRTCESAIIRTCAPQPNIWNKLSFIERIF